LKEAALREWIPGWFRRWLLGPLALVWPKADWLPRPLRAKILLTNLALDAGAAYGNTLTLCRQPLRRRLMAPDLAAELNGHQPERLIRESYEAAPRHDPLAGMIAADTAVLLPDDFLVKVDRASMANGLEVRPPLLDHELLELAARIPSHWKVYKGQTKWIFKQAYQKVLPKEIVWRPKHGFEMPVDGWLRQPLREMFESTVLAPGAQVADLIDQQRARRLYRAHLTFRGRHGNVLWSLLILARWAERYLTVSPSLAGPSHAASTRPLPVGQLLAQ
jgi:asparagine synthase (glutamine-hydrolysing)